MTNFKIPKIINVCGHGFKIVYRKNLKNEGSDCYGLIDFEKEIIYLATGMTLDRKKDTLLHEVIHAISHLNNFNLSENATNLLALNIIATLKTNKLRII